MARVHTVRQGEDLHKIARAAGFRDADSIHGLPENAALREQRPSPSILHPGDRVTIPDISRKESDAASGQRHRFQRKSAARERLELLLEASDAQSCGDARFTLTLDEAPDEPIEGTTESDGRLRLELTRESRGGVLRVYARPDEAAPSYTVRLAFRCLDPVIHPSGLQARLNNLGFDCGPVDGTIGPRTEAAIRDFQRARGLEVDGVAGPITQRELESAHRC